MRLLALDLATHTGWALLVEGQLHSHGTLDGSSESSALYPYNILDKSRESVRKVVELVRHLAPDEVVIEDTNPGGRASRHSQRYLEQAHCFLLAAFDEMSVDVEAGRKHVHYVSTIDWRKAVGLVMTATDRANNKALSKVRSTLKKQLGRKPTPKELSDAKRLAGISGKRTIKHASVEWANKTFGLALLPKDADAADAIGLGAGWLKMTSLKS